MRRREFVTLLGGAALASPLAVRAQQAARMRRIGVLSGYAEDDPETKSRLAAFRAGLAKRGWAEGRNVRLDYRFAAGSSDQYPALAKELIALDPDVILAHTTLVTAALQRETRTIPIVFVNVSDPIGSGFIASLARPGGNITGVLHYEAGIVGKWLGLLKEIAPRLVRIALLGNPKTTPFDYFLRSAEAVAPSLSVELIPVRVEYAAADIERAIDLLAPVSNSGIVVAPDVTTVVHRDRVIALAARHRLPAVYPFHLFVADGGLMSYGTDQVDMFRQTANYVDRILRGDKPADLPVQAPTRYETAINLKTAKALGLTVPNALLVAADEVIE
jgi:putative ABC transport system substrate-binding protein